jgi:hypothetical protein
MAFLERNANRGSISTGYDIDYSLKLEADNSEYLKSASISTTPSSTSIGTYSCWIKRTELGLNYLLVASNSARYSRLFFNSNDQIQLYSGDGSWNSVQPITNAVYRDTSAWYHLVLRIDATHATAASRLRLYMNGVEQTWATAPNISQNSGMTLTEAFGSPGYHGWGVNLAYYSASAYFSGYLAEARYIDGQSLAPSEFGETDEDSGIWKPKEYDGSYGNTGYYMDFADSGDLGDNEASTGSTFDFSENNIAAADQATDTPTNNFCTFNNNFKTATGIAATEGQTTVTGAASSGWLSIIATFGLTSGKWYWEAASSGNYVFYGIADVESNIIPQATGGYFLGYGDDNSTKAIGMYGINGTVYSDTAGHNGPGAAANTVVQIALDMDNRCVYFGANGSYISGADPTSGASKTNASQWNTNWTDTVYPALSVYQGYNTTANFGGYTADVISSAASDGNGYGTFEYAPPSGYYAICTKNLAEFG